jgi:hypothetical protein
MFKTLWNAVMALGLIVAAILAAVWELQFAASTLHGNSNGALLFVLGLWAVVSVVELWHRYVQYERILAEHGLLPLRPRQRKG